MKRINKTQLNEPIAEISSASSDSSNSDSPEQSNVVKSSKLSHQGSNMSGKSGRIRTEEDTKLTKSQKRSSTGI